MERKIGEIFEYNGEWYQCVEGTKCRECDFSSNNVTCDIHGAFKCTCKGRSDGKSVIFKKLEKVGEPYIFSNMSIHNITMQRYKVFVKPIFTNNSIITTYNMVNETISIEIKNKEDMEESVEEKLFCDKVAKANAEYMKVKLNSSLKPFDLEAAKAGKPVCTRDGRKARIICFDSNGGRPIVALVTECDDEEEIPYKYHCDGSYNCQSIPSDNDLMMLPEKHEGWVNVYKVVNGHESGKIFATEEEAKTKANDGRVATIKIEWED